MEKVLRCECGYEVRARGEPEFVAGIRRHARKAHGVEFTREEALVLAFRAELDDEPRRVSPGDLAPGNASSSRQRKEQER
jgi:hypothetical protein